jgi:Flp pilus assembly pilin Flp
MATKPGVKPKLRETCRLTPCGEETVMDLIIKFAEDESGATAVEYAFLLTFIAVALTASLNSFGSAVAKLFNIPWP